VPMHTPTPPVTRDSASAAWVPPSSCRTMMWRIFSDLLSAWYNGRIAAPGMPKTNSTPSSYMI
jgi:hypothetical protein